MAHAPAVREGQAPGEVWRVRLGSGQAPASVPSDRAPRGARSYPPAPMSFSLLSPRTVLVPILLCAVASAQEASTDPAAGPSDDVTQVSLVRGQANVLEMSHLTNQS